MNGYLEPRLLASILPLYKEPGKKKKILRKIRDYTSKGKCMSKKRLFLSAITALVIPALMLPINILSAEETSRQSIPIKEVQLFSNALSEIKKYYIKPVSDKELFENAIRGMVSGLDPHSNYLDADDFKELYTATSGEFGGLGIEVTTEDGVIKVITPLVDTPAYKAGLKTNDYIIKLGTKSVQGLTLKEAVNIMRGKPGTSIELTVLRKGENKPLFFTLTREKIQVKSVKSQLFDQQYGYIRLSQFQALTAGDMERAVTKLKEEAGGNLKGLILDLRNNPGGLLDSAIRIADDFLDTKSDKKELIVYTKGRLPGSKFVATATPGDILNNAPLLVLINNGSASASEIVAGALKDNKRALILGTRSFGKGSVQTVLPLDNERGIKLTTALYYTPAGVSIQAQGITPDIVIEDVAIPKASSKGTLNFSEADLSGHLLNGNLGASKDHTEKKDNFIKDTSKETLLINDKNLLYQDYQLYAALTILKGLAIAQH